MSFLSKGYIFYVLSKKIMNDRFRSTLQFLLTGLLIGVVVNQIFSCFIMGGYVMAAPESTSTATMMVRHFKVPFIEIAFLLGLSLNFLRISHGLIVLETSKSCRSYQECMERNSFKWIIPSSQIICLLLFVLIGIYLVLFGLPNFEQQSFPVLFATMALFIVILWWDAPTCAVYLNRQDKKNISVLIEIVFEQAIGKPNGNDCIAKALINWVVYDLACVVFLFLGFAIIGNLDTDICWSGLGCLPENYIKLSWAAFLLILVALLDYWHPKLLKGKGELPLFWLMNGVFYWGDEDELKEARETSPSEVSE